MVPLLLDVVVPTVGYFVLHAAGLSDFWALAVAGSATALVTVVNTVKRRRLDALGVLVVIEIALSVALLFVTRDPRILLVKPSFFVAVGGIFCLVTLFLGRPLVFTTAKPMATKGDPRRAAAYEMAWDRSPRFRQLERTITAAWGIAFVAEAVLRALVVYHYPADQIRNSILLSQAPGLVLIAAAIAFTRGRVPELRSLVDQFVEELPSLEAV
jgi:intracellular septation protein A